MFVSDERGVQRRMPTVREFGAGDSDRRDGSTDHMSAGSDRPDASGSRWRLNRMARQPRRGMLRGAGGRAGPRTTGLSEILPVRGRSHR